MSDELYKSVMGAVRSNEQPLMLAKWGTDEDNAIRAKGSKIQSPTIAPDSKLNFEQRILRPNDYPSVDNGDGSFSTHRMAYGETDGRYLAYPTIVQEPGSKKLKELDDRSAYEYAMRSGEFRSFNTEEEAKTYSEGGYKKFWGLGEKK